MKSLDEIGLLNGHKHTITNEKGEKRTPYARILVRPTIQEIARRYLKTVKEMNMKIDEELVMTAFLDGAVFLAQEPERIEAVLKFADSYDGKNLDKSSDDENKD